LHYVYTLRLAFNSSMSKSSSYLLPSSSNLQISGFRKFPVGVVAYLTWPKATYVSRITSTHHLWTIPLYMHAVNMDFDLQSWYMSIYLVVSHVLLSGWLTPFTLPILEDQCSNNKPRPAKQGSLTQGDQAKSLSKTPAIKYLNVNLAHEWWKGVKFVLPPGKYYVFRLLFCWQLLNLSVFSLPLLAAYFLKAHSKDYV
jgi:hypothetical protein